MFTLAALTTATTALLVLVVLSLLWLLFTKTSPPGWPAIVLGVLLLIAAFLVVVGVGG